MSENEKMENVDLAAAKSDAPKKVKTPEKKPGIFARLSRWMRELRSELKKVAWPTRSQVINNTLVVIACVLVVGACIWVFDWLAGSIIDALLALFKG